MVTPYNEGRIIVDPYDIAQSLKQKTRVKRTQGNEMEFAIHDEMDIAKITLKELLSASKTKVLLTNILGNVILEEYKISKKKVVVVKGTTVQINQPHSLAESMSTRNHEEAGTMIPLHVTVSCPKKCGPSRGVIGQYTALRMQLPYQLCVGNYSGPPIWRARSFLRQEQH